MKEIEKKYLLKEIPDLINCKYVDIEQSYLNISPDPILRLRKYGNKYYLTYKSKIKTQYDLNVANEYELPICKEVYDKLLNKIESNIVKKRRYFITLDNNLIAELDIYDNQLKGFANVEIEFKNEEEYKNFIKPNWFGKDITKEKKFINSNLSTINELSELMEV